MEIRTSNRLDMHLRDLEIDAMKGILKLAAAQLNSSDVTHMRGTGIPSQSGFCGDELHEIREMIERLGMATGADIRLESLSQKRISTYQPIDKNMSLIKVEE